MKYLGFVWVTLVSFYLAACASEVNLTTNETEIGSDTSASSPITVSAVSIANDQITVTGTHLDTVSRVSLQDKATGTALSLQTITPQTLVIQSQSDTRLVLTAASALELTVGAVYNFIFTTAHATETTVAITYTLATGSLALSTLSTKDANGNTIASGKVLQFDGTTWVPADVTSSSTGVSDGSITAAKLADSAVTSAKIAASAVTATKIEDGTITAAKLVSGLTSLFFHFNAFNSMVGNGTQYVYFSSAGMNPTGTEAQTFVIIPRAGTLTNFTIRYVSGALETGTATFTIRINQTSYEALTLSFTATDTQETVKTDTDTVAVIAGDRLSMSQVIAGGDGSFERDFIGYIELK